MQKYVGWKSHTKANRKKRSQCGNDVCKGDFFFYTFSSALSFLSVEGEKKKRCDVVKDGVAGLDRLGDYQCIQRCDNGV